MDTRYIAMSSPPADALKEISFGALKGKSDINPQWRYEVLTAQFGLCGIGWKWEPVHEATQFVDLPTCERMVYVMCRLYVKDGDVWSEPIYGNGGDYVIKKDKNGIRGNDEAIKMAYTDALGKAASMVGVAASVYRGTYDTKYSQERTVEQVDPKMQILQKISAYMKEKGIDGQSITQLMQEKYNKESSRDLTLDEANDLFKRIEKFERIAKVEGAA